jgi:hypothetical protein
MAVEKESEREYANILRVFVTWKMEPLLIREKNLRLNLQEPTVMISVFTVPR